MSLAHFPFNLQLLSKLRNERGRQRGDDEEMMNEEKGEGVIRELMVFSSVIVIMGLLTQSHMRVRLMYGLYSPFNINDLPI